MEEVLAKSREENRGGIDLSPAARDNQQSATGITLNPNQGRCFMDGDQIQGLAAVIFQILPIPNLPLLLGMDKAGRAM